MPAILKQSLVLLTAHGAIDQFEELNFGDAGLPGHFLEQAIPKVLRAAVACLGADCRLLSVRRPKEEPMVVASSCWNPFFFRAASTSRFALTGNRHLFHDGEQPVFQFQCLWG